MADTNQPTAVLRLGLLKLSFADLEEFLRLPQEAHIQWVSWPNVAEPELTLRISHEGLQPTSVYAPVSYHSLQTFQVGQPRHPDVVEHGQIKSVSADVKVYRHPGSKHLVQHGDLIAEQYVNPDGSEEWPRFYTPQNAILLANALTRVACEILGKPPADEDAPTPRTSEGYPWNFPHGTDAQALRGYVDASGYFASGQHVVDKVVHRFEKLVNRAQEASWFLPEDLESHQRAIKDARDWLKKLEDKTVRDVVVNAGCGGKGSNATVQGSGIAIGGASGNSDLERHRRRTGVVEVIDQTMDADKEDGGEKLHKDVCDFFTQLAEPDGLYYTKDELRGISNRMLARLHAVRTDDDPDSNLELDRMYEFLKLQPEYDASKHEAGPLSKIVMDVINGLRATASEIMYDVVSVLRRTERYGAKVDDPVGSRFLKIPDSHAQAMVAALDKFLSGHTIMFQVSKDDITTGDVLVDVATVLGHAHRQGLAVDEPEGSRYIALSETLTEKLTRKLECLAKARAECEKSESMERFTSKERDEQWLLGNYREVFRGLHELANSCPEWTQADRPEVVRFVREVISGLRHSLAVEKEEVQRQQQMIEHYKGQIQDPLKLVEEDLAIRETQIEELHKRLVSAREVPALTVVEVAGLRVEIRPR